MDPVDPEDEPYLAGRRLPLDDAVAHVLGT